MIYEPDFDEYERFLIKEMKEGRLYKAKGLALWMRYNNLSKDQLRDCVRVSELTPATKVLEEQSGQACTCQQDLEHDESCPLYNISQEHITAAIDAVLDEEL